MSGYLDATPMPTQLFEKSIGLQPLPQATAKAMPKGSTSPSNSKDEEEKKITSWHIRKMLLLTVLKTLVFIVVCMGADNWYRFHSMLFPGDNVEGKQVCGSPTQRDEGPPCKKDLLCPWPPRPDDALTTTNSVSTLPCSIAGNASVLSMQPAASSPLDPNPARLQATTTALGMGGREIGLAIPQKVSRLPLLIPGSLGKASEGGHFPGTGRWIAHLCAYCLSQTVSH